MDNKIICNCYKVSKKEIVEAIDNGADTIEKIGEVTKAGTGCGGCKSNIEEILREENEKNPIICGCYKVRKLTIEKAIKNGADTVEKIGEVTKAGTGCGGCKAKLEEILLKITEEDPIICGCYKVRESTIKEAIKNGADTVEKISELTKAGTGCGGCKDMLEELILKVNEDDPIVCGCYKVRKSTIREAIENGADTVEKVGAITKAGTGCGACKTVIEKMIKEVQKDKFEGERILCNCFKVKEKDVIEAIKAGAKTVEEVGNLTKAGVGCGRCRGEIKKLIEDIHGDTVVEEKGFFSKFIDMLKGK